MSKNGQPTPPEFIYFDLGMVLLTFSFERMCRQMGEVAGLPAERVRETLFKSNLLRRYESGELSTGEFYESFCDSTGTRPDFVALNHAACDIFALNMPIVPLVGHLAQARCKLGVLSNTCPSHIEYCLARFPILRETFSHLALSYELRSRKPDAAIYRAAAGLAGVEPGRIFFVDDLAENVAGARAAGFDAVHYTTPAALAADLRKRGVKFNG